MTLGLLHLLAALWCLLHGQFGLEFSGHEAAGAALDTCPSLEPFLDFGAFKIHTSKVMMALNFLISL